MKVDDIIKAIKCCSEVDCINCPLYEIRQRENCQIFLAELIVGKLVEMRDLLDDSVNHHYNDVLEYYQEENTRLKDALHEIKVFVNKYKE